MGVDTGLLKRDPGQCPHTLVVTIGQGPFEVRLGIEDPSNPQSSREFVVAVVVSKPAKTGYLCLGSLAGVGQACDKLTL